MIPSLPVSPIRWRITILVCLSLAAVWLVSRDLSRVVSAQGSPGAFRNFEGPQIHPLALTPDGSRLLAVNTPNATLSIFQLVSGSPVLTAEIPVGLEPVSVAVRNNREAWVANWLSDSVSIVDLSTGNVTKPPPIHPVTKLAEADLNQHHPRAGLPKLTGGGSRFQSVKQPGELHGECRPALTRAAPGSDTRAGHCYEVHARMPVEPSVFFQQERLHQRGRHFGEWSPEAVLIVRRKRDAQQFPVGGPYSGRNRNALR